MHHDPLLSSARKPFASFGHVWVVLAVWLPLPFGSGRGFALPVLFRLYVGAKRGGERQRTGQAQGQVGPRLQAARTAHAQHQPTTKLELLREMVALPVRSGPASGPSTWWSIAPPPGGRCWRTAQPPCRWSVACAWTRRCMRLRHAGVLDRRGGHADVGTACLPSRT